jgi:hypothetical protein
MINKIYKRIHNKYSTLFKFIFFLRYLFGIFFIAIVLFLSIPHFFDFEKKDVIIKNYLLKSYGLKIGKYENIKYHSLPRPHLKIRNTNISTENESIRIYAASLSIYPQLLNIYNYKNFEVSKIVFNKNKILLLDSELKYLLNYIYNLKKKLLFKNLDLKINKNDSSVINFKKVNFSNYGYNKNIIRGELFEKKFEILLSNNYNKIIFKLLKTGITADINFNEIKNESKIRGVFKSKLLTSNLKFNFDYDDNKIRIYNSYFRSRDLSFNNKSTVIFSPFFSTSSFFKIEEINLQLLKDINLKKILSLKNIIKKINTENEITFKSKKFNNNLIDDLNLDINLAYGRLFFLKKISISENFFTCKGNINLLEEYPILYFDCLITSKDKKKLLKKFSINYKSKNELLKLKFKGNINIFNNKVNFKNIEMSPDYKASKEDLNFFKQSFQNILFNKDFLGIFNLKKIKDFILEVS